MKKFIISSPIKQDIKQDLKNEKIHNFKPD